jgi:nucleotide-binding universal stress UspA family protein
MDMKKILVATDGSERAQKAGEYAIELAKKLNADIDILAVTDEGSPRSVMDIDPDTVGDITGPGPADAQTAEVVEQLTDEKKAPEEQFAERLMAMAKAAGVTATKEVTIGSPADVIVERAASTGADMIVMGSHGRSAMGAAIMGSVTTNVIHKSKTPVLVVTDHK